MLKKMLVNYDKMKLNQTETLLLLQKTEQERAKLDEENAKLKAQLTSKNYTQRTRQRMRAGEQNMFNLGGDDN